MGCPLTVEKKKITFRLLDDEKDAMLSIAKKFPAEDGRLYNDEVVLNCYVTGRSPKEVIELMYNGVDKGKHRRGSKGILYACNKCGVILEGWSENNEHVILCDSTETIEEEENCNTEILDDESLENLEVATEEELNVFADHNDWFE